MNLRAQILNFFISPRVAYSTDFISNYSLKLFLLENNLISYDKDTIKKNSNNSVFYKIVLDIMRDLFSFYPFSDYLYENGVKCALLYGSFCKGDWSENSDIDLCFILNDKKPIILNKQIIELETICERQINIGSYTFDEWSYKLSSLNSTVVAIASNHVVVFSELTHCKNKNIFSSIFTPNILNELNESESKIDYRLEKLHATKFDIQTYKLHYYNLRTFTVDLKITNLSEINQFNIYYRGILSIIKLLFFINEYHISLQNPNFLAYTKELILSHSNKIPILLTEKFETYLVVLHANRWLFLYSDTGCKVEQNDINNISEIYYFFLNYLNKVISSKGLIN